jgi:hypothetical protein
MHLFSSGGLLDNVPDGRFFRQLRSAKSAFLCGTSSTSHGARRPLAHAAVPLVPVRLGRLSGNP